MLAASLRVWFAQPRRSDVRIKIRTPDGATVDIDAKRVSRAEEIIRNALAVGPGATVIEAGQGERALESGGDGARG